MPAVVGTLSERIAASPAASDGELMHRIQRDDADAFGELFDRYVDRAGRIAHAICRDHSRAEEAVQEAFMAIWTSRGGYRHGVSDVAAWAMTIVRNRAIDRARSTRTNERSLVEWKAVDDGPGHAEDPAVHAVAEEHAGHLRHLLARLPQAQCEVIALAYYGELSHSEIAEHLGLPAGTVKSRMRLGLQKLSDEEALRAR